MFCKINELFKTWTKHLRSFKFHNLLVEAKQTNISWNFKPTVYYLLKIEAATGVISKNGITEKYISVPTIHYTNPNLT